MAREQVKRKKAEAPAAIPRGVLIKGGARIENDAWIVLDDEAPLPGSGDVVVSLTRFRAQRESLLARSGKLGILLTTAEPVEEIGADACRFALIMVQFPAFRDGRGFTTAQLLRQRYHYKGELRATGDVLEDLVFFMLRVGFDAFELIAKDPEAAYARAVGAFTQAYQGAADGLVPAHRLRARRAVEQAAE